jgi:O-6-methylguanine DNA methyltransferase
MKEERQDLFGKSRNFVAELRRWGKAKAPAGFLPAVMRRAGLDEFYFQVDTPVGQVFVASGSGGISAVMRGRNDAAFERSFRERFGRPVYPAGEPPKKLIRDIAERLGGLKGKKMDFDLSSVSDFENAVLRKTLEIPRGEVRPYAWIAREIGRPKAVRAVGTALARNPIPLLIPCHRVVRSDGRIGEYALGREAKRAILEAEGVEPDRLENLADEGMRFWGSATTHIFCYPTCRQARRISEEHRVLFKSEQDAFKSGFRPCKICRPAGASETDKY